MARTSDIGLRREPQPPMPMVMPSRSSATTSSSVHALVGHRHRSTCRRRSRFSTKASRASSATPDEVELEGEALLEAVAALHVDRVDAVERLLGGADDGRALGGDVAGHLAGGGAQLVARARPRSTEPKCVQLGGRGRARRCRPSPASCAAGTSRARWVAAPSAPRSTSGRPKVASLDGDDDVGVADQADAAAEAVAVHGGDDRDRALVDGGEGGVAAAVGADQRVEALGAPASP